MEQPLFGALNAQQHLAATHGRPGQGGVESGPVLIIAGAGTGKTTIHSAKGQEWKHVFVLNVNDGNFPNEFACGEPARIEEERRLLYVAMTRAKESLSLMRPLKYWVLQQARHGDKHVYGAKSRFLTATVMKHLQLRTHAGVRQASYPGVSGDKPVMDLRERASSMF